MTARVVLYSSVTALLCALLVASCSEGPAAPSGEGSPEIPEVSVVELQPAPLAVIRELPGRITPTRIAEVRARVPAAATLTQIESTGGHLRLDLLSGLLPLRDF